MDLLKGINSSLFYSDSYIKVLYNDRVSLKRSGFTKLLSECHYGSYINQLH